MLWALRCACSLVLLGLVGCGSDAGADAGSDAATLDAGSRDAGRGDAGDADGGLFGDGGVERVASLATALALEGGSELDIEELFWNPEAFPDYYGETGSGSFQRVFVPPCQDGSTPTDRVCPDGEPVRCTDGSRPVAYFRAGTSNRWIFRVQNGGVTCEVDYLDDGSSLRATNCWHAYASSPEGRNAFSSLGSRERNSLDGIYRDDPANPFRAYNVLFLDKCVGDRNLGDATIEDYRYRDRSEVPFTTDYVGPVYFHGFRIIEAALRGMAASAGSRPVDAIAFQTHSNGSNGQYMYIDRLADIVREIHPSAEVRGIATGMLKSSLEVEATADPMGLTASDAIYDQLGGFDSIARHISADAASPANGMWISSGVYQDGGIEWTRATGWGALDATPTLDQSCLDAHPGEPSACLDHMHVLLNHISTPLFLVAQQADPVINRSQHVFTTSFDMTTGCDPGAACCHDENYMAGLSCTTMPGSPFFPVALAEYSPAGFADRVVTVARGLVEGLASRSEMRPGCSGAPCDPSPLPSPRHGGFVDDAPDHFSVQEDTRALAMIGGRTLVSYLQGWLEMGTPTLCVDVSGGGVAGSGTAAPWAPCP